MHKNYRFSLVTLSLLVTMIIFNTALCGDGVSTYIDPYQHTQATVRLDSSLSAQEKNFIAIRKVITMQACGKLLDESLWGCETPTIALCFSGGGYRAMVEAIGFLKGAQTIGLLDATMYTGGLSGSTWALTPWVLSGLNPGDFKEQLKLKINCHFSQYMYHTSQEERQAIHNLKAEKYADKQSFGLVDIYGSLLANRLLTPSTNDKQHIYLSDLAPKLAQGAYPLPICTAVAGGFTNHHLWFEFTPYEIGCTQTGFIPTWAFGRKFEHGQSVEIEPGRYARQQSLGYCMGIWGSAFAVDGYRLHHELRDVMLYQTFLHLSGYMPDTGLLSCFWPDTTQNFAAATVGNFTHNMAHTGWKNWWTGKDKEIIPLADNQNLSLIDGAFDLIHGCGVNLGIIPLLRPERNVDVIIICDSSADLIGSPALYAAEQRARTMGLKFPEIDYSNTDKNIISVFEGEYGDGVPTVIYMPGIRNAKYGIFDPALAYYTSTANFCYTPEQIDELSGLTEFAVLENRKIITDTIRRAVDKKRLPFFC